MALNEQIRKAISKKGIYYYFLPTYKQAKQVCWDALVDEHIPKEVVEKKNDSELAVYYKNGSIQRFAGCEDIDKHRGINPTDAVLDEYSEINEEMWTTILQPVFRENKGSCTFIFTPKGKNHSWKLLQLAKDNSENWWWSVKTVLDTNSITEEELEEAKKNTPQAYYNQEYMCDFLDNAGAFFTRIRENTWSGDLSAELGHFYQIGVDLAKYQDWTVITPFDKNTFKAGNQLRFNQVDWNLQKARIEAECLRYNRGDIVVDSTGVGDPIAEDLIRAGLPVTPFKFTESTRNNLLENLSILLAQDKIKIPNDEGLIAELESFQYTLNDKGKIKVQILDNMHDDRVMSLALAVWGITRPLNKIGDENQYKLYVEQYD